MSEPLQKVRAQWRFDSTSVEVSGTVGSTAGKQPHRKHLEFIWFILIMILKKRVDSQDVRSKLIVMDLRGVEKIGRVIGSLLHWSVRGPSVDGFVRWSWHGHLSLSLTF